MREREEGSVRGGDTVVFWRGGFASAMPQQPTVLPDGHDHRKRSIYSVLHTRTNSMIASGSHGDEKSVRHESTRNRKFTKQNA